MGLFDFGKKKETRSKLDLPPKLDMSSLGNSSSMPNIPDDIPMQLPKVPEMPREKHDLMVPSFGDSPFVSKEPAQAPAELHQEVQPSASQPSTNVNFDQLASELKSISDTMQKDPNNPFEIENASKNIGVPGSKPNFGILEGEEDHGKVRGDLSIDTPIYVNVIDFATILEDIAEIKEGVSKVSNGYLRVTNILKDKDVQFANYDKFLEDIQKKLVYIDKALFEN